MQVSLLRHCERREAIQKSSAVYRARERLDCRGAVRLAVTQVKGGSRRYILPAVTQVSLPRHCERREAIQKSSAVYRARERLDCRGAVPRSDAG